MTNHYSTLYKLFRKSFDDAAYPDEIFLFPLHLKNELLDEFRRAQYLGGVDCPIEFGENEMQALGINLFFVNWVSEPKIFRGKIEGLTG